MSGLFRTLIVTMLCVFPLCFLGRVVWAKIQKRPLQPLRELVLGLFWAYAAGLAVLVTQPGALGAGAGGPLASALARIASGEGINLVPLRTIASFFAGGPGTAFVINIVANVLMFLPLGFSPPLLWRRCRRPSVMLPLAFLAPLAIEITQLFLGRSCDIDDLLLNALGMLAGWGLFALVARRLPSLARQLSKPA